MPRVKKFFICLRLSRDDIRATGHNPNSLSDKEMQEIANEIGESCTGEAGTFWTVLEDKCSGLPEFKQ